MTEDTKPASLPSPLTRARESWHSNTCPGCGGLKRQQKWFCIACWGKLQFVVCLRLTEMRRGWVSVWSKAVEQLKVKQ